MQDHAKQQLALGPATHFRGYQQLGANVTRYDGGFQRDWHEAIDLYKEVDPQAVKVQWWLGSAVCESPQFTCSAQLCGGVDY